MSHRVTPPKNEPDPSITYLPGDGIYFTSIADSITISTNSVQDVIEELTDKVNALQAAMEKYGIVLDDEDA